MAAHVTRVYDLRASAAAGAAGNTTHRNVESAVEARLYALVADNSGEVRVWAEDSPYGAQDDANAPNVYWGRVGAELEFRPQPTPLASDTGFVQNGAQVLSLTNYAKYMRVRWTSTDPSAKLALVLVEKT